MFPMHFIILLATFSPALSLVLPDAGPQGYASNPTEGPIQPKAVCPAIWKEIASDLQNSFADCNNDARSAIRFAFHDGAGYSSLTKPYGPATGGADGSLLLSDSEIARTINDPMQDFRNDFLLPKYKTYKNRNVGAADFVQFAGVIGTKSCPGGPVYKAVVGRIDDATACPLDMLPEAFGANSSASVLLDLWAAKGFDARELAALLGAHSVSKAFAEEQDGIPSGGAQDTTPTTWDANYYKQTQNGTTEGVYSFDSDKNLAKLGTASGRAFTEFGNDFEVWGEAFKAAMYKLSVLGIPESKVAGFIDCSSAVE
ncbi:uncharacterized protein RCC_01312 [Ramularia collo-cygni]|uniref:Peroxidase n=1 Tax=Ramularia collo-cygni TaxID=112498 RepID=A0A2D3UQG2_9PEZI|nr:uncharacterized protein RCC_01312 [Ramularia collo-cygni]CZT15455.1 uncharacterized protein RCC_01312 [Ramularia collo-cygni]